MHTKLTKQTELLEIEGKIAKMKLYEMDCGKRAGNTIEKWQKNNGVFMSKVLYNLQLTKSMVCVCVCMAVLPI